MKKVLYYFAITLTLACGSYIQSCSGEDFDEPWQGPEFKTRTGRTRSTLEGPVIFPTTSMIAGSQEILSRMNDSWEQTLASCTSTKRREYGFYIYYDYMTGAITGGINYAGQEVSCGANASLHMGSPTNTSTLCGMFHTHTSLEYCDSTKFRNTGPTDVDVAAANQKQIPGFLYDYEAPVIHGGDSKNAPKKLYIYGQYSQRPPMN